MCVHSIIRALHTQDEHMLPLYITSGEPAGIGPDICLSLANVIDETSDCSSCR